ncbi:hypothetical protein [Gelidibacter mesophilus]|uniref:hypothetical protein n=1 Tax=Gelidibacter mesophilus TaxID=169050 RepID=UPI00041AC339|nr:hypothetical protein [Gelidibacter mesophilus]
MNKNKLISGGTGILVGYVLMILFIDILSKPNNVPLALKPIESIATYFFGFTFTMGTFGWVLGSLILIGYLIIFYFIGTWINKLTFKN